MRFSVIHPSARPDQWRKVYEAWLGNADQPQEFEYVVVTDRRWGFRPVDHKDSEYRSKGHLTFKNAVEPDIIQVENTGRRCYVDAVNLGAKHATGDVLIVTADDQFPCAHWDTELKRVIASIHAEQKAFVIAVNTNTPSEKERGIIVLPIVSRARYEDLGYIIYPKYESMFADNDLYEQAKDDGVLIEARHLLFPHKSPLFDGKGGWNTDGTSLPEWDEAYKQQNRPEAYELGRQLLEARRACGFRDVALLPELSGRRKTLALCLPGETFSQQFLACALSLYGTLSRTHNVVPILAHSSDVAITRHVLAQDARKLNPDYIAWIDDDNLVSPHDVLQLISDLECIEGAEVAAGWCYTKSGNISCGRIDDGLTKHMTLAELEYGEDEIKEVEWTGFPLVVMRPSALAKCGQFPFMRIADPNSPFGFRGEDYSFCARFRDAGGKVYMDRRVRVPHLKLGDCGPSRLPLVFDGTPERVEQAATAVSSSKKERRF